MTTTIAMTGEYTKAILMHALLTGEGIHVAPIQQQSQITALGAERGYRITVPKDEASDAAAKLLAQGFEKCLCG